jgi:hypothetical protein
MRAWIAIAACAGCHWAAGGYGRSHGGDDDGFDYHPVAECRELRKGPTAPAKPADAHPDFARLGAERDYFRVTAVGDLADHFLVFSSCIEEVIDVYAVLPDGTVRWESGGFGGLGMRSGTPRDVPADKEALAQVARAQHDADYEHAPITKIEYLGAYREVTVEDLVPVSPPGDPYARMTWHQQAIVPMNADLTEIVARPGLSGGETRLCWKDINVLDCGQARWMDFTIAPIGAPQLAALLTDGSPAAPAEKARFAKALFAAAKGAAPAKLDDLLAVQGGGLLPDKLEAPIRAGFSFRGAGTTPIELRVPLSIGEIARGTARGRATAQVDGVTITLAVEAAADNPTPAVAHGDAKLRVHIDYALDDGRGPARTGRVAYDVEALLDGDRGLVTSLGVDAELNKHANDAPLVQKLPGGTSAKELRADFGVAWMIEPWYPK